MSSYRRSLGPTQHRCRAVVHADSPAAIGHAAGLEWHGGQTPFPGSPGGSGSWLLQLPAPAPLPGSSTPHLPPGEGPAWDPGTRWAGGARDTSGSWGGDSAGLVPGPSHNPLLACPCLQNRCSLQGWAGGLQIWPKPLPHAVTIPRTHPGAPASPGHPTPEHLAPSMAPSHIGSFGELLHRGEGRDAIRGSTIPLYELMHSAHGQTPS